MKKLIVLVLLAMSYSFVLAEDGKSELTSRAKYQIINTPGRTIRLDLVTGQAWYLISTPVKSPDGSEPVNYYWWRDILEFEGLTKVVAQSAEGK